MYTLVNKTTQPLRALKSWELFSLLSLMLLLVPMACNRSSGSHQRIYINEVVSNISIASPAFKGVIKGADGLPLVDADGQAVDWVELYNPSQNAINLSGYTLSDDISRPRRFKFPQGRVLGPGEFILVVCDGRPELGPLHAEFKLRGEGETVYFFADNGNRILDRKGYVNSQADSSVGRFPDGTEQEYGVIFVPTPGESNKPVGVRPPNFSGASNLAPAGALPEEDPLLVTVTILEDREVLAASLTFRALGDCGDPDAVPSERMTVNDYVLTDLGTVKDTRRNFRGNVIEVDVQKLAFTFQIPHFPEGTLLELDLFAENIVGDTRKIETQVVGGSQVTLAINEYQPRNVGTLVYQSVINAAGEDIAPRTPDWLEILNFGDQPIDLSGFSLIGLGAYSELQSGNARRICGTTERTGVCGNDSECLYIWQFDDVPQDPIIQPGEKRIILADADCPPFFKEYRLSGPDDPVVHYSANFQISGDDADIIVLRDPCGVVIDVAEFDFSTREPLGEIAPDLSFGRYRDGAGADPDVPVECNLSTLDPPPGDDNRIYLTPGCEFNCPSPGTSNELACDVGPTFDSIVHVNPRCPKADESATVRAFLSIDQDTVVTEQVLAVENENAMNLFDVSMTYEATLPNGEVESGTFTRADGLFLNALTGVDSGSLCSRPNPINGAVTFEVTAIIPGFPKGTLVTFSYGAVDHFMADLASRGVVDPVFGEPVVHVEEDHPTSSFRYLSGYDPVDVRWYVVLPQNISHLAQYYTQEQLDDPDFRLPDFAELYNFSFEAIDIGGMYLTDSVERNTEACGTDFIREVRKFMLPEGLMIEPKSYILLLFVNDKNSVISLPEELASRTVLVDTMNLDNVAETLYLISQDEQGHCVVDSIRWDQDGGGEVQVIAPEVDRSFGWLPDQDPNFLVNPRLRHMDEPTPGAPNCPYEALRLVGDITHRIAGALDPMGCVSSSSIVLIQGQVKINAHEWLLDPDANGLELAELVVDRDGVEETLPLQVVRKLENFGDTEPPTICEALLSFTGTITPPQTSVVTYTVRLMDKSGSLIEAGPFSYGTGESTPEVAINEAQLINTETIMDKNEQFSPWIELHNSTGEEYDMGGLFLTDDLNQPRKWMVPEIPEAVLPSGPGAFMVIFMDGDTLDDQDLHASLTFNESGSGRLYLLGKIDEGHCVIQTFDYDFTDLENDITLGLLPDGEGETKILECATPGRSNLLCDVTQKNFVRGDANGDLRVNISDMAWIFRVLFGAAGIDPACEDSFDTDDDGEITIQDGLYIGDYLFLNGPTIPGPFPNPGQDLTPDSLNCF